MIIASNLLVNVHRSSLDEYNMYKIIFAHEKEVDGKSSKKEVFASTIFHDVMSNECTSTNEDWNY